MTEIVDSQEELGEWADRPTVAEPFDGMDKLDMLMSDEVEIGQGPRLVYVWDGQRYQVPVNGVVTVGRSNPCDIQIPARVVSRQHFHVEQTADGLILHSVGTVNPCTLNGTVVEKSARLTFGDLIEICGIYFLYVE